MANTVVFITSGTTFTVPSDFSSLVSIEAIGAGGDNVTAGGGGSGLQAGAGGGAYAKITSLAGIGAGSVYNIKIGIHGGSFGSGTGSTSNTCFDTTGTSLIAAGGANSDNGSNPSSGGLVANCIGTTKFKGGDGAAGGVNGGGGGGGAAGPSSAGGNGVAGGATGGNGGAGGTPGGGSAGTGSSIGGGTGGTGGAGTTWTATVGGTAGPGGGAGGGDTTGDGGTGGLYGGGAGGEGSLGTSSPVGQNGIIVFTYTPTAANPFHPLFFSTVSPDAIWQAEPSAMPTALLASIRPNRIAWNPAFSFAMLSEWVGEPQGTNLGLLGSAGANPNNIAWNRAFTSLVPATEWVGKPTMSPTLQLSTSGITPKNLAWYPSFALVPSMEWVGEPAGPNLTLFSTAGTNPENLTWSPWRANRIPDPDWIGTPLPVPQSLTFVPEPIFNPRQFNIVPDPNWLGQPTTSPVIQLTAHGAVPENISWYPSFSFVPSTEWVGEPSFPETIFLTPLPPAPPPHNASSSSTAGLVQDAIWSGGPSSASISILSIESQPIINPPAASYDIPAFWQGSSPLYNVAIYSPITPPVTVNVEWILRARRRHNR